MDLPVEALFPGSDTPMEIGFTWRNETRTLRIVPATPLEQVMERVEALFDESDTDLVLTYEYGSKLLKTLVIRSDAEFQAACITWPGCKGVTFEVQLAAMVNMDFDALCLRRLDLLDSPAELASLDAEIMSMFEVQGVSFIMTMGDVGDVVYAQSIYAALALIMKMRQITHPIIRGIGGNIVKFEGEKTFVVFGDVQTALAAGILIMQALAEYNSSVSDDVHIEVSIGIDHGPILLLGGHSPDEYGDCINTSSKLGEDTAEPGELLMSDRSQSEVVGAPIFADVHFERDQVTKSGVDLVFYRCSGSLAPADADALYARAAGGVALAPRAPSIGGAAVVDTHYHENVFSKLCRQRLLQGRSGNTAFIDERIRDRYEQNYVIACSDMSGFTSTTRARGILHFLMLIMKMRQIVMPILEAHGGRLIKFEADNVYAIFPDPDEAVQAFIEAQQQLAIFNDAKDQKTDKALMGVGLAMGPILDAVDDEDAYGVTRNIAEVLGEDEASGELILIDESVRRALRRSYALSKPQEVEGFEGGDAIKYYFVQWDRL